MTAVLLAAQNGWECPNCTETLVLDRQPLKPILHPCRGLRGILAPMVPAGTRCKVETNEREDYIGSDIVAFDGNERPIMNVTTTRDDGTDCVVFAPCVTARIS